MKKLILFGLFILVFCCAVSYALVFNSLSDAQSYYTVLQQAPKSYELSVYNVESFLQDDFYSITWSVCVYDETEVEYTYYDDNDKLITDSDPKHEEIFCESGFSQHKKSLSNTVIAGEIKALAKEKVKNWRPNPKIVHTDSVLYGAKQVVTVD